MLPVDRIDSMFRFVIAVARRARQLQAGAKPLIEPHARKSIKVAQEEILAGSVRYEVPELSGNGTEKEKKKKSAK